MGSEFLADRCKVIDTVRGNPLIRGNMPLINGQYALREIQAASGVEDLLQRKVIEIPIIDNVGEREQFAAIVQAFGIRPERFPESEWPWWQHVSDDSTINLQRGVQLSTQGVQLPGSVIWRPFEGLPEGADPIPFLSYPGWDFAGFVVMVLSVLNTEQDVAVYVHCQLGADRTGAFHIGYLMQVYGKSLAVASSIANNSTAAGAPNADYQRLVEAYAEYLGHG